VFSTEKEPVVLKSRKYGTSFVNVFDNIHCRSLESVI
jgi:hypothetical protein